MKTEVCFENKDTINAIPDKEWVYNEYHGKVERYIGSKISNYSDIDDLVSTVFVKVYSALEKFDSEKASFSTWIYTISRNVVTDYYRERGAYLSAVDPDAELDDIDTPDNADSSLLNNEMLEKLAEALERLPKRERDIVIFHDYKNIPLTKIAEKMSMSYANVKVVHNKALEKLRVYLGNYL